MGRVWKDSPSNSIQQLDRLQSELKEEAYRPQPVRQVPDPEGGKAGRVSHVGNPDDL